MSVIDWLPWRRKSFASGGAGFSSPSQGYLPTLGATPSAAGINVSQGTAMSVSAVYACVTIRSEDLARCTPRLFRRDDKDQRVEVKDHPVAKLFRRPNRIQTWMEFAEQMNSAYLLRGNAYAAILRDGKGRAQELIPINPDAVLVMESGDGSIFYNVNRIGLFQIAVLSRFPVTMAAEDIFHLRGLTFNALVAASRIGLARDAIGVSAALEQQAARWMKNGAKPSYFLQSKKSLSEIAAKRLKKAFEDYAAGLLNVGNTMVLEDGIEAKEMQLKGSDIAFIEQRGFQIADIARFYRTPLYKIAVDDALRGVNLVAAEANYVSNAIAPDLDRWEQKIAQVFGLDDEDLEVQFDPRPLLRADITARYAAARVGLGGASFLTVNEVRRGEGLPAVPEGDTIYQPANMASIGSDISGEAPDGAGRPPTGTEPVQDPPGAG